MIISWKPDKQPIKTAKAYGFKIKHNDEEKIMWIPNSMVVIPNANVMLAEIPDWLYDKKIDELFML